MDLRTYLRLRGIKQTFIAKQLGVCRTTLYRYMKGRIKTPSDIKGLVYKLTNHEVTQVLDKIVENNSL